MKHLLDLAIGIAILVLTGSPLSSSQMVMTQTETPWTDWASIAWRYFQPNVGVNPITGLNRANLAWNYATDWDLGSHIISVIMAKRTGLIQDAKPLNWGFKDRIGRMLQFLENRPLGVEDGMQWPFLAYRWDYDANDNFTCGDYCGQLTNGADSARLLGALDMLRQYDPSYTTRVQMIYERTKGAYDAMFGTLGNGYYDYYYAKEYEAWGYNVSKTLRGFENFKSKPTITLYGVPIPPIHTVVEPILYVLLELEPARVSPTFVSFARSVYEAQSARFSNTGLLTAWSEGGYFEDPYYVYETILDTSASPPLTWVMMRDATHLLENKSPVAYTKVAFAYLALYGSNAFTSSLVNATSQLAGVSGFGEAILEDKSNVSWGNAFYSDKTNQLVLTAAAYALSASAITTSTISSSTSTTAQTTSSSVIPEFSIIASLVIFFVLLAAVIVIRRRKATSG